MNPNFNPNLNSCKDHRKCKRNKHNKHNKNYVNNHTNYYINNNDQNKILRLFGRQEYPGSSKYEYYTMVNNGSDQIKLPIYDKRKNELYDGDIVYIRELDSNYKVSMHKYDQPKYYPDLMF